jgi:hypothetical protein
MSKDIAEYIRSFDQCQQNKLTLSQPIGLLQPLEVPSSNCEHVTMDFNMDLPQVETGHDAILVAVDKLSKAMTLIPTKSAAFSQQVEQLFLKDACRLHGLPRNIISDRDVRFSGTFSNSFTALCKRNWRCRRHFIREQAVTLNELTEHWTNSPTLCELQARRLVPKGYRTLNLPICLLCPPAEATE